MKLSVAMAPMRECATRARVAKRHHVIPCDPKPAQFEQTKNEKRDKK